jgi:hypothetical protein
VRAAAGSTNTADSTGPADAQDSVWRGGSSSSIAVHKCREQLHLAAVMSGSCSDRL